MVVIHLHVQHGVVGRALSPPCTVYCCMVVIGHLLRGTCAVGVLIWLVGSPAALFVPGASNACTSDVCGSSASSIVGSCLSAPLQAVYH